MTPPAMPPATTDGPPKRPDTIVLGVQLWVAVIVLQIVATASKFNVLKADYEQRAADVAKKMNEPSLVDNSTAMVVVTLIGAIAILCALAGVLMWFTYAGRNWARLLLGWASAFLTVDLAFAVVGLFVDTSTNSNLPEAPAWGMIPTIIGGVCAVGALVALMHRDSSGYCRDMAKYRLDQRQNRNIGPGGPGGQAWPTQYPQNQNSQGQHWQGPNGQNGL